MIKKGLVEKLREKYFLASHPYPKLEGEMIIFRPRKEDQTLGKDVIVYRDYSLRKRIETTPKENFVEKNLREKKKSKDARAEEEAKKEDHTPTLQCLDIDITEPLSDAEWNNLLDVANETQGLAWFQILPVGQKSSMPWQFNMLHVLPQVKIPVERLPIDVFIHNYLSHLKKKEKGQGFQAAATFGSTGKKMNPREEMEDLALQQGLFMIPEFQFDHVFISLDADTLRGSMPCEPMKAIY